MKYARSLLYAKDGTIGWKQVGLAECDNHKLSKTLVAKPPMEGVTHYYCGNRMILIWHI